MNMKSPEETMAALSRQIVASDNALIEANAKIAALQDELFHTKRQRDVIFKLEVRRNTIISDKDNTIAELQGMCENLSKILCVHDVLRPKYANTDKLMKKYWRKFDKIWEEWYGNSNETDQG